MDRSYKGIKRNILFPMITVYYPALISWRKLIRQQKEKPSLPRMSGSIRCGLPSITNIQSLEPSYLPAVLEPWGMDLEPASEPSAADRKKSASISAEMDASV